MPIRFRCACGKSYQVAEEHAGRSMPCKACGENLTVPATSQSSSGKGSPKSGSGKGPPPVLAGKRKKKSKRRPEQLDDPATSGVEIPPKMIAMFAVPVVLVLCAIGYGVYKSRAPSGPAKPAGPAAMTTYVSEHGNFRVDHPEDWSADGGGGTGGRPPWVKFEPGDALFQIRASPTGASIGDIAGAGAGTFGVAELPEDLEPVAQVHEFRKIYVEADYNDYEETPAEIINLPYGEGRISEFTGDEGLLGADVRGYRVTLLGTQFQYNVIAKCPEDQWDDYSATFKKMIDSIDK